MENVQLKHLDAFRAALADYHLSAQSTQVLKQIKLVLLVAPTASGRNTVIKQIEKTGEYYFIVSDTTRPPKFRDGHMEQNGREYFFRSEDEVLADIQAGAFLEAALIHNQQVSGVSIRELERAHDMHKVAITDIEIIGADNVMKLKPDTICVFVLPPSFEEWQRRIRFREDMPDDEFRRRLTSALKELEFGLKQDYYYYVINDSVEEAAKAIDDLARFDVRDENLQQKARQLAQQLYDETLAFLSQNG